MTVDQITYLTFGLVLVVALVLDLGLMSKKNTAVSMKKALYQTLFWVLLSIAFCISFGLKNLPLLLQNILQPISWSGRLVSTISLCLS